MLEKDFREFIELLNANGVKYLIVGGYAVALHGYPRYTKDLDIWVDLEEKNSQAIIRVLDQFGLGPLGLAASDFMTPDVVVELGYPPNRIDILVNISGVEFIECYQKKVIVNIDGVDVQFIDLESLKKNKNAAGRSQDLADVEHLK